MKKYVKMPFWKFCWNPVGIGGGVISTGYSWGWAVVCGCCVVVGGCWVSLRGTHLNNLDGDDASSLSGRRGTVATSSPPSTHCCSPCCYPCVPWGLWAVSHRCCRWWPLAKWLGRWERLASMVVVGREGLLIVCPLLMTTNRVSGFADARFGCTEEIRTLIDLILLPSNGYIVQRKECSFG